MSEWMYLLHMYLSLMQSFSVSSVNIVISHIFRNNRFSGLHFCRRHRSVFNHLDI